jgi:hypothetical protein
MLCSAAALSALEEATGMKYDDDKPKRGSELLEVSTCG